jgi:hypothetical protein
MRKSVKRSIGISVTFGCLSALSFQAGGWWLLPAATAALISCLGAHWALHFHQDTPAARALSERWRGVETLWAECRAAWANVGKVMRDSKDDEAM